MVAIGVGVLGVIGVGFIGFRLTQGVNSEFVGGASSPEGAVEQFTEAINGEDILGALSFVAPDEVDGVSDVVNALIETLDAGAGGLGDGSEADVSVELTALSAKMDGENAAIVEFEIAGGIQRGEPTGPIGVSLPSSVTFDAGDLDDLFPGSGSEVQLVTVKLGGNWYISPMLSFGNLIAEANDLPGGDFSLVGEERTGGGKDPEDAVEQMFDAIADFEVDDVVELLGGGEGRFATVFADAIQELVDEIPSDVSAAVDVTLSPLDDGRVEVEEIEGSVSDLDSSAEFSVKNDCVTVTDEFDSNRECLLDEIPLESSVDDTVFLDTVEEDGGTRVRLVPSASDIASRIVSASSRQLLIYAVGLAWADTATPVAVGSDTDIDFDGRLYVVHEFGVPAGTRVSVDTEESNFRTWIREGDGTWEQRWENSIESDQGATVRVVSYSDDECGDVRCFPSGEGSDTLRVRQVSRQAAAFPAILSGELGPGDQIVFDLTVTEGQTVQIDVNAADSVVWQTETGAWIYLSENVFEMVPGEYTLVIRNDDDSVQPYELVPSAPTIGFAGSRSTKGSLGSGGFVTDVALTPGSFSVTATPSDSQDIVLVMDGADCYADQGLQGDGEVCYIDVSDTVTLQVAIYGYSQDDEFGSVTLSLD